MYLLESKILKKHKNFKGDESIHVFIADVYICHTFQIVHIKYVQFIAYQLYLNAVV